MTDVYTSIMIKTVKQYGLTEAGDKIMFKVYTQDFNSNWNSTELASKQDVFSFIVNSDPAQAIEIEDVEFEGSIPTVEELEAWLNS